ncbi:hypothetical protein LBMAG39_02960 [Cyanobium sp.]|nr:hypothetical protein LBMAG39_02960 [Cyanobium sp.]
MNLLHDACAERIVGGSTMLNITNSVSNVVSPVTVKPKLDITTSPRITAKTLVANQSNLSVGVIASGAVNSSFLGSQIVAQFNDLVV